MHRPRAQAACSFFIKPLLEIPSQVNTEQLSEINTKPSSCTPSPSASCFCPPRWLIAIAMVQARATTSTIALCQAARGRAVLPCPRPSPMLPMAWAMPHPFLAARALSPLSAQLLSPNPPVWVASVAQVLCLQALQWQLVTLVAQVAPALMPTGPPRATLMSSQ